MPWRWRVQAREELGASGPDAIEGDWRWPGNSDGNGLLKVQEYLLSG